ncbi:hypothetical protein M9Y10_011712 [Tritrichomonas musculus]|uniref:Uncharacterized protein n=1 Tax=Tritrichomonas musculus TaxID=1915356 RepID=A0ABR2IK23_9EUKA
MHENPVEIICEKIIPYIEDPPRKLFDQEKLKKDLFNSEQLTIEEEILFNEISVLVEIPKEIYAIDNKKQYIEKNIAPKLIQAQKNKSKNQSESIKKDMKTDEKPNGVGWENIDKELLQIKGLHPEGIDTSDADFKKIADDYKNFFQERCENIVEKNKKNIINDIELREFMIRHNRFVPLFNLPHISADLLEQMAARFSRMKKDPDEIEKEYDKIELK